MISLTEYIYQNSVEDMVAAIIKGKRDIKKAIKSTRDCRTAFQIKSQQLQWELEKLLPVEAKYEVKMELIAREDFLKVITKGDIVKISRIDGKMITLDEKSQAPESSVRLSFDIKE